MKQISTCIVAFLLIISATFYSCQKDKSAVKPSVEADSLNTLEAHQRGNYLALHGLLKIKVLDSTYTFDASSDSIAFVNISIKGQQYYGLTAINKAHTLSFGISSFGAAETGVAGSVAGSQFLVLSAVKPSLQYTLSSNMQPGTLAKLFLTGTNRILCLLRALLVPTWQKTPNLIRRFTWCRVRLI